MILWLFSDMRPLLNLPGAGADFDQDGQRKMSWKRLFLSTGYERRQEISQKGTSEAR